MDENCVNVSIKVPFPENRLADIAYHVLRVDGEPKRSGVKKELSVQGNILVGKFSGVSARQLRVGVNCFFDNISLILETFDFAGPPTSETYNNF